jgi:TIR domain
LSVADDRGQSPTLPRIVFIVVLGVQNRLKCFRSRARTAPASTGPTAAVPRPARGCDPATLPTDDRHFSRLTNLPDQIAGTLRYIPTQNPVRGTKDYNRVGGVEHLMAKKHVFLSYCCDNQAEIRQLRDELVAAGENVWWDEDIQPGQDWKLEIKHAMKDAYAVVLCLSTESAARETSGIYPEAMDAIELYRQYPPGTIFLIPVRLSKCEIPPVEIDSTKTLDRLQYQDLFPSSHYAAGIQKLLQAIRATPHHP